MKKEIENPHCRQPLCSFDVFPCTTCISQKFQVQAKIPTMRPLFPDYLSVSYDYAVKLQTCVTNEVVYYLSSIKDDVWYNTDTLSAKLQL